MSARDELRMAAERLREVAGKATPGPWEHTGIYRHPDTRHYVSVAPWTPWTPETPRVADDALVADAAYIALVGPTVGLALADWLDAEADEQERLGSVEQPNVTPAGMNAYRVARAILGTGADQ